MTREEVIKWLKEHYDNNIYVGTKDYESHRMAIEALERENVLDKIRFEIEHMACRQYEYKLMLDREDVLKVFSKYRGEQMDLIDREQLMNYIRSKKINIGKLAHDVIMKQPSIQKQEPFDIETYCKEHFCVMVDKDVWEKAEKVLEQKPKTIQEIQAESEKYQKAFEDGYEQGYAQARFDYEQEPVLDKVRAEVEAYQLDAFYPDDVMMNKRMVLEIIDKYRGEEDENSD